MRPKTLEIRWHDTQPIFSSDAQLYPQTQLKRLLSQQSSSTTAGKEKEKETSLVASKGYRLATGGADNHVRLWMIHPNVPDVQAPSAGPSLQTPAANVPPPRAEFLATLRRHTAAVNVVRWSPKEEVLASAGDDGFLLLWVPKSGSESAAGPALIADEEGQKEFWRVRQFIRATVNEIYDLAWSPDGSHIIVGCTDNTARIYDVASGSCVHAIAEHDHFVQGVAWDPLNEFVATQSSDRSVRIYRIHQSKGKIEFLSHSQNDKLNIGSSRHPSFGSASGSRPILNRRDSTAMSDTESVLTSAASDHGMDESVATASSSVPPGPLTPSASHPGTPAVSLEMKPPSRRSSISSSIAASPPPSHRLPRSPSPLPAIRPNSQPPTAPTRPLVSNRLYGDESFTHYFRRLAFSPDGALLLTPAGQIESSLLAPAGLAFPTQDHEPASSSGLGALKDGKPKKPVAVEAAKPTVYIYSRANLSNAPIAHLPGQKTASVAVRFSPIFYDLRETRPARPTKTIVLNDNGTTEPVKVKLSDAVDASVVKDDPPAVAESSTTSTPAPGDGVGLLTPTTTPLSAVAGPHQSTFALPYRMYFAVATQDAVLLYDTQQTSPVAIFVGHHYAGLTDLTWSQDGQTLLVSSIDGYCTVVAFDPAELGTVHHTQQHSKQVQALVQNLSSTSHHSAAGLSTSLPPSPALSNATPTPTLAHTVPVESPVVKRTLSVEGGAEGSETAPALAGESSAGQAAGAPLVSTPAGASLTAPPAAGAPAEEGGVKKKRRVELKHLGPLE